MEEEGPLGPRREPTWDQKVIGLNAALRDGGVPYAFGGAIALNYHREPRSTLDIDLNIFLAPEHEEAALGVLGGVFELDDEGRVRRELRREGQTRSRWGNTFVDLFLANTEFHAAMAERVEHQPFGGATIPVLSIEDLLICKALFDRSKDWVDIEAVAQARRGELDRPYITAWLGRFLPDDDPRRTRIEAILG
jgi:Nucleotidyl transferase AbiEii toxin, Type IV TA system